MNIRAAYKDDTVVTAISTWWATMYDKETIEDSTSLDIYFDYVSYLVETVDMKALETLPNYSQFVKCLHVARIIEFAPKMWQQVDNYSPSFDKVRRVVPNAS